MGILNRIKDSFNAADFDVKGQTKVKTLKKHFTEEFGCTLRVYYGKRFANDDYTLAKILIAYSEFLHPVNWELQLKTEESFSEKRAIVYDSVGTGLGQYRYDSIFNTYVSDPNGAYIASTVPTGDRFPTTVLEGAQRIGFDFGKIEGFPNMLIRSN